MRPLGIPSARDKIKEKAMTNLLTQYQKRIRFENQPYVVLERGIATLFSGSKIAKEPKNPRGFFYNVEQRSITYQINEQISLYETSFKSLQVML